MTSLSLHCISSMATRLLLADLAGQWQQRSGVAVRVESVGGVDAAKRVAAGEAFDLVVLAADPHDTDPDQIKNIPVLRTIVDGKTVYSA